MQTANWRCLLLVFTFSTLWCTWGYVFRLDLYGPGNAYSLEGKDLVRIESFVADDIDTVSKVVVVQAAANENENDNDRNDVKQ